MKPISSLFVKILCWFFLNLILVIAALTVFFAFQSHLNLYAIFGKQGSNRLRTAGILIARELRQAPREIWTVILARHAEIHQVNFTLVLQNGLHFSSMDFDLPEKIMTMSREILHGKHPWKRFTPPYMRDGSGLLPRNRVFDDALDLSKNQTATVKQFMRRHGYGRKSSLMMRTRHPTRYWAGIRIPLFFESPIHPMPAMILAVSDSMTGNGFFFDPLPWMVVAAAVILLSTLLWIPMVRNITRPLVRMTHATEKIAKGSFDVSIDEPRGDEIGRLAKAINHMNSRLSSFVKGQKRFLADAAHELGSPIARIQFGLGALEQRVEEKNRKRVLDVIEDVEHMSKLVSELLAFSRADLKSNIVGLEKVDLLPIVQTAVKREVAPNTNIIVEIDPEIRVVASPKLLTRALANLLRNAVKYAESGGAIYVTAEKIRDAVEIKVRDSGPGVPEYLIDQLFEPFFRPEASRDRESGGVGLGLAIVKTCVETCEGTVSAANLKPNGLAITITLSA